MMDKLVASFLSTVSAFYAMAASIAIHRAIFPSGEDSLGRKVMKDRASAWTATSVMFGTVALVKMGIIDLDDEAVGIVIATCCMVIFVAGLNSVRVFTLEKAFGRPAMMVFAGASIFVGLLTLFA